MKSDRLPWWPHLKSYENRNTDGDVLGPQGTGPLVSADAVLKLGLLAGSTPADSLSLDRPWWPQQQKDDDEWAV